jgi:AcrR family transcriptional regulator
MGRPKGKALSVDDVLASARELVERDGFSALTLANAARALGIKPPSLCHHVSTTEELRLRFAAKMWLDLAGQLASLPEVADPRRRLVEYARAMRRFALAHPRSYELMTVVRLPHARVAKSRELTGLLVPVLASFGELGLPAGQRVHAARALRSAVTGFMLLEIAGQFQLEGATERSFERMIAALLDGLVAASRRRGAR